MTHTPRQLDFFGSDDQWIGLRVQIDRDIDRLQPCHNNICEIAAGRGPHGHALLCEVCGRFRGWLPKTAAVFLTEIIRVCGVPDKPLIYRDQSSAVAGADGRNDASAPNRRS
jgi:hypothetical protein